jgi:hypothetical protein
MRRRLRPDQGAGGGRCDYKSVMRHRQAVSMRLTRHLFSPGTVVFDGGGHSTNSA